MEKFKCAYCGQEWDNPLERAKCEMSCAEKIKQDENQKVQEAYEKREEDFVNRVEYLRDIYSDVESMIKSAEKLENELREDYPDKESVIDRNFPNKNIRNNENYITVNFDSDCDVKDLYRKIEKQLKHPFNYWNLV